MAYQEQSINYFCDANPFFLGWDLVL